MKTTRTAISEGEAIWGKAHLDLKSPLSLTLYFRRENAIYGGLAWVGVVGVVGVVGTD